ncbi:MAG: DUF3352 domain-containing protein, partial [Pyrinomonadaceae bacterium]
MAVAEPTPGEITGAEAGGVMVSEEATLGGDSVSFAVPMLGMIFGRGEGVKWPQAVAAAVTPEGDDLALRVLMLDDYASQTKMGIVPFLPFLIPGPALRPEAADLLPADTEIFASASLDLSQIYDWYTDSMRTAHEMQRSVAATRAGNDGHQVGTTEDRQAPPQQSDENKESPVEAQIAAMEKLLGFKIKEDLIGALGNEVAVGAPASLFFGTRPGGGAGQAAADSPPAGLAILISLKNREALEEKLPRVLFALGLAGGGGAAVQTEKREGVEITSFGAGALAFVGNFLVLAPDLPSVRRVVDAHASGQTLSSTYAYRNSQGWQPRQVLGQVYVSNALMKSLFADARKAAEQSADPELKSLLPQLTLDPGAITHAVTDEGDGPLHELRLPRNLITLTAGYA